jgi:Ca2+-binding RTX toxin-like protein
MSENRVNTTTAGLQANASVTGLADGGWVVTWNAEDSLGNPYNIYQQTYNADGSRDGGETLVNSYVDNSQDRPVVARLADGGWVVAWMSAGVDSWAAGIAFQRYNADGTTADDETVVNTYISDSQYDPGIAGLAGGGFVVVWSSTGEDGSGSGIYQRLYNSDGTPADDEVLVNTYTTGDQRNAVATALDDGGWVVTWVSDGQDGSGAGIYQQRYQADGTVDGGETQVNVTTARDQSEPSVTALSDGGWVVTWTSNGDDGSYNGVFQRRFDANGDAVGSVTQVNSWTYGQQSDSSVTALADGGWVVVWVDSGRSSTDIYSQRYASDGTAVGGEWQVNVYSTSSQSEPSVAALDDGGYVITWTSSGQDGSGSGVYQQRFDADGYPEGSTSAPVAVASEVTGEQAYGAGFGSDSFNMTDADGDTLYSITIVDLPDQGALSYFGTPVYAGQVIRASDIYKLTYTAEDGEYGDDYASFTFRVTDSGGRTSANAATMMIDITKANEIPQTIDDSASMREGSTLVADVLANDSDPDGDTLSIEDIYVASDNADAVLTGDGKLRITYTGDNLDPGETATIEVYYTAGDGRDYATSLLTVTVNGVAESESGGTTNAAPVVVADTAAMKEGETIDVAVLANDSDADGDALSIDAVQVTTGNADATVTDDGLLRITYTGDDLDPGETATIQVSYAADDGTASSSSVLAVTVTGVAEAGDDIVGTGGADHLVGTKKGEAIYGLGGKDQIEAKGGKDTIYGSTGKDQLTGGGGADTFVFASHGGKDVITDFKVSGQDHDILDLSAVSEISGYQDLINNHVRESGGDLVIVIGKANITLQDVHIDDLSIDLFVF